VPRFLFFVQAGRDTSGRPFAFRLLSPFLTFDAFMAGRAARSMAARTTPACGVTGLAMSPALRLG
jgi:hypothetical protein